MPSISTDEVLPPIQSKEGHTSYPADDGATITTGTGVPPSSAQPESEEVDGLGEMQKSAVDLAKDGFVSRPGTVGENDAAWVEKAKPVLPWKDDLRQWRGNNPATSRQIARRLRNVCAPKPIRKHGRQDDGVMDSLFLYGWTRPFEPRAELMVQMVTSCLALEQRRRMRGDDLNMFAASLRSMKHEDSWLAMADTIEEHLINLDLSPTLKDFGIIYGCIAKRSDPFPDHPVHMQPKGKSWLARQLARMDLTKGNSRKAALVANFKARIVFKFKQRKKKEEDDAKELARQKAELEGMPTPAEEAADFWGAALADGTQHEEWVLSRAGLAKRIQERLDLNGEGDGDEESADALRVEMELNRLNGPSAAPSRAPTRAGLASRGSVQTPQTRAGRRKYFWEQPRRKLQIFDFNRDDPTVVNVAKLDMLKAQFSQAMSSASCMDELWEQIDINASGTVGLQEWMIWVNAKFGCLAQLKANNRAYRDTIRAQDAGKFDSEDDDVEVQYGADGEEGYDPNDPNHVAARMAHKRASANSHDAALNAEINLVDHNSDLMRELYAAQHSSPVVMVSPIPESNSADQSPVPRIDITRSSIDWGAGGSGAGGGGGSDGGGQMPGRMKSIDFETIDSRPESNTSLTQAQTQARTASRGMGSRGGVGSRGSLGSRGVDGGGSRQGSRGSGSGQWGAKGGRASMMPRKTALELLQTADGGMLRKAFPFFITRLFRMSQLWFAFQYLDISNDDRVDLEEYLKGRKKFRTALDLDLEKNRQENMDPDERLRAREQEFDKMCDEDQVEFGWSRIAHWYCQQLERGFVNGMGDGWVNNEPAELYKQLDLSMLDLDSEVGATLDLDDFCDLVLYCHYNSRVHVLEIFSSGHTKLPSIGGGVNTLKGMKKITSKSSMDVL